MPGWMFPPRPSLEEAERRRAELELEKDDLVRVQHIVSKVVLKSFGFQGAHGGHFLIPYNVRQDRELRPTGLRGCGQIPNFVRYASRSLETLWKATVEDHLHEAVAAVNDRSIVSKPHLIKILRDCIALHMTRSPWYLQLHSASIAEAKKSTKAEMVQTHAETLQREFFRKYGLYPAGKEALGVIVEHYYEKWDEYQSSGILERQSLEETYARICGTFDPLHLQFLIAPPGREFLVSDSPAFTYTIDHARLRLHGLRRAIGDSNGAGMPITPECFISVAPESAMREVPEDFVDHLNGIQVQIAHEHVYYREGSPLRSFVSLAARQRRVSKHSHPA